MKALCAEQVRRLSENGTVTAVSALLYSRSKPVGLWNAPFVFLALTISNYSMMLEHMAV